jgi:hypothetical protein
MAFRAAVVGAVDVGVPLHEMLDATQQEASHEALRRMGSHVAAAALLRTTRRILSYGLARRSRRAPLRVPALDNGRRHLCGSCQSLLLHDTVTAQVSELHGEVAALRMTRIAGALRSAHGNRTVAAKLLGMKRTTLVEWLHRGIPGN